MPDIQQATFRRVTWRLVPFLGLLYLLNILDRSNVGFARLTMKNDLGMSDAMFDVGYGIFYLGYVLFEVPSNLLLHRVGARRWIARIMVTWGLISAATMFTRNQWTFYSMRILLGVAEAGFFPGIVLYLSYWFPDRQRGRIMAIFMLASPLAGMLGNPLSGLIMEYLEGTGGLHGWQWLFLLEGVPSVVVGVVTWFYLTDYPRDARWLTEEQRSWLVTRMQQEESHRLAQHSANRLAAMLQPRVWLLVATYFTVAVGSNCFGASSSQLIEESFGQIKLVSIGLIGALPNVCGLAAMSLFAASSDRTGERRFHLAAAASLAAFGWGLAACSTQPWQTVAGLCLAQAGMMSMLPVFWTVPTAFLSGEAAAGGIALINSVANIGGFLGPAVFGRLRELEKRPEIGALGAYFKLGLAALAVVLAVGAILATWIRLSPSEGRGDRDEGDDPLSDRIA